ncbi:MAG: outer membrane protein transport protein [Desulfobacteraceae bacterium]|jgi:long-chain fatty acid transport protein
MRRLFHFLTAIISSLILSHSVFAATIADTYGLSPKGMGMGNAMTAHVNDWSSVYYNISGLGRTSHLPKDASRGEFFAGYLYTKPSTELDIPKRYSGTTYYDTNADEDLDFGSFVIGAALDLNSIYKMPKVISSSRFGLALSVGDDLTVARANDVEPQTHNYLRFGKEAQQMMFISGVGLGFLDDSFGIGIGIKSSFGGKTVILLEDVQVGTDPQTPRQQTSMDLELDTSSWVAGLYIDFGKMVESLNGLSFGFAYREESKFELDLKTISVVEVGGIPLDLNLSMLDYYQPASFNAGLSYRITDRWLVAVDVEHQTWSDYDVSSNQSYHNNSILPELDDICIPKIGLQYRANPKAAFYLGYYYQPSFVPDDAVKGDVNWLDNDKHVASIGLSYDTGKWAGLQKPMVLHAGYQFQYLVDRTVEKDTPTTLNPSYSYGGTVHTVTLGFSF